MLELRIISGPGGPREFRLTDGETIIGRNAPNAEPRPDISIDNMEVSRIHARLTVKGDLLTLEGPGANGVEIGGVRIQGPTNITPGSRFTVCDTVFEIAGNPESVSSAGTVIHKRGDLPLCSDDSPMPEGGRRKRAAVAGSMVLFAMVAGISIWVSGMSAPKPRANTEAKTPVAANSPDPLPDSFRRERLRQSMDEAGQAKKLFSERKIRPGNRYRALVRYRSAIATAGSAKPGKTLPLEMWIADTATISAEIDSMYQILSRKAIAAFRQGRDKLSRAHLQAIMDMIPDTDESRFKWAKKNMISLDRK